MKRFQLVVVLHCVFVLFLAVYPACTLAAQQTGISAGVHDAETEGDSLSAGGHAAANESKGQWLYIILAVGVFLMIGTGVFLRSAKGRQVIGNLKIQTAIFGLAGALLVMMVAVTALGINMMNKIGTEIDEIAKEDIPLIGIIGDVEAFTLEQMIFTERAVRSALQGDTDGLHHAEEEFVKLAGIVDSKLAEGEKLAQAGIDHATNDHSRREFEDIAEHIRTIAIEHDDLDDHITKMLQLLSKGFIKEATAILSNLESESGQLDEEIMDFLHQIEAFTEQSTLAAEHYEHEAVKVLMAILIFSLIIGAVVTFFIGRAIVQPIGEAVKFAELMAAANLTSDLDIHQKNEVGVLAGALNTMAASLKGMITNISNSVATLTSSSTELSAIAQQMSAGAEQTSTKSDTVSTSAEELSTNMNSVSAAMEQTSTNTSMVASAAEEMTATINEIAKNAEHARSISDQAVTQTQNTGNQMSELGNSAKAIGKVTETITEISEQTNLLALNATIEAARAGEAGKGFAVVANEIKDLAKQTAEATLDIKQQIEGIQGSTSNTIESIDQIGQVINNVNEIVSTIATAVEEQSVSTKEISENIAQVSNGIGEVNENVAQSSHAVGDISKDITEVNQAANEITSSSSQVSMSAEELSKLSEQLNELVGQFRI